MNNQIGERAPPANLVFGRALIHRLDYCPYFASAPCFCLSSARALKAVSARARGRRGEGAGEDPPSSQIVLDQVGIGPAASFSLRQPPWAGRTRPESSRRLHRRRRRSHHRQTSGRSWHRACGCVCPHSGSWPAGPGAATAW